MGKNKLGLSALLDNNRTSKNDTKAIGPTPFYKFFNMKRVIDLTNFQQDFVYNNLKGMYNSWTPKDKGTIAKVLIPAVQEMFKKLGYDVEFKKNGN